MQLSFKTRITAALAAVLLVLSLAGCATETDEHENVTEAATQQSLISSDDIFTANDMETGYSEDGSVLISLADNGTTSTSESVIINGNTVTIKNEGDYVISGTLSDGSVIIDSTNTSKLRIILNGADISSSNTAPIYIKQADKVFMTLAQNSENTLSVTGEYVNTGEDNIDSAVFSKDDLTVNGSGTLNINASYGHGIVSKDDLNITSGIYNIAAASHGITGKDRVCIADGTFTIVSGKDGIRSENTEDTTLGYVYIGGGNYNMNTTGDGISASGYVQIEQGEFNIQSGGGSANGETHMDDMFGGGMYGGYQQSAEDSASEKGIKATGTLLICGGVFNIDSADDALHSNSDISITGGTFAIKSGDDGFHADSNTSISGGTITINESYEGIEGHSIDIKGGVITLNASDDGLNAAGGNDESGISGFGGKNDVFANDSEAYINISGGKLIADADGDGIDSNGALYVSGGETYVAGPTNSGNGSLDYGGEAVISGGIFIATGAQGMASNFSSSSTQGVAMLNTSSTQSGKIEIFADDGTSLASFSPNKSYNNIIISCPEMSKGNTYTVKYASASTEITLTDTVYGQGSGMPGGNMGGGNKDGGFGGKPRW